MTAVTEYRFDRCGERARIDARGKLPYGWGRIETPLREYDVCGNCVAGLRAFIGRAAYYAGDGLEEESEESGAVRKAEGEVHQAGDERGGGEEESGEDQQQLIECPVSACTASFRDADMLRGHLVGSMHRFGYDEAMAMADQVVRKRERAAGEYILECPIPRCRARYSSALPLYDHLIGKIHRLDENAADEVLRSAVRIRVLTT